MNFLLSYAYNFPRLNLHGQIALVLLLSTGVLLAKARHFRMHAVLQSTVVLLNLGLILRIMLPSFRRQLSVSFPMSWKDLPVTIVLLHASSARRRGLWLFMSFWLQGRRLFHANFVSRTTGAGCGPYS
jgi:hypothetical protein